MWAAGCWLLAATYSLLSYSLLSYSLDAILLLLSGYLIAALWLSYCADTPGVWQDGI
jgi:hypothetical protein